MGAIAPVTEDNYNILAFLHYISTPTNDREKDFPLLARYALQNGWSDSTFVSYTKCISKHCKRHLQEILLMMGK